MLSCPQAIKCHVSCKKGIKSIDFFGEPEEKGVKNMARERRSCPRPSQERKALANTSLGVRSGVALRFLVK
jgi:hypothetical protein